MASELKEIASKEIEATPMISHGSWGHRELGTFTSSLTLYNWGDPTYYQVEWHIPDIDAVEHIGCTFDASKTMTDYDGIMDMPDIVVTFLVEQGFIIPEEFQ